MVLGRKLIKRISLLALVLLTMCITYFYFLDRLHLVGQ